MPGGRAKGPRLAGGRAKGLAHPGGRAEVAREPLALGDARGRAKGPRYAGRRAVVWFAAAGRSGGRLVLSSADRGAESGGPAW
jgi:hypothetical protein